MSTHMINVVDVNLGMLQQHFYGAFIILLRCKQQCCLILFHVGLIHIFRNRLHYVQKQQYIKNIMQNIGHRCEFVLISIHMYGTHSKSSYQFSTIYKASPQQSIVSILISKMQQLITIANKIRNSEDNSWSFHIPWIQY